MEHIFIERPDYNTVTFVFKHPLMHEPKHVTITNKKTRANERTILHDALEKIILMLSEHKLETDIKRSIGNQWTKYDRDSLVSTSQSEANAAEKSSVVTVSLKDRLFGDPLRVDVRVSDIHPCEEAMCEVYYMVDRFYHEAVTLQDDFRKRVRPIPEIGDPS